MEEDKFDRGTSITIFKSDRFEDIAALVFALVIAIGVLIVVGK